MVEGLSELPNLPALRQIVDAVGLVTWKGETQVRLHLHPESLGQLLIQVHVADGDVSVRMLAETPQTQALIQDHLSQLKAAFAAQGLQVDGLAVAVGSDSSAFDAPGRRPGDWSAGPVHHRADSRLGDVSGPTEVSPTTRAWDTLHRVDYHV
jgi:hypothetical protein